MTDKNITPQEHNASTHLSADIISLAEQMARNVHDTWAAERMRQGWTWGAQRNDELKHHPCLVPYDELPEEEKVYDRNTSLETLRFIISQGYRIVKE